MNLIILGGNNPNNKEWSKRLAGFLSGEFETIFCANYSHWNAGDDNTINLSLESDSAMIHTQKLREKPFAICAKSAGTLLAMDMANKSILKPEKILLIGVPIQWSQAHNLPVEKIFADFRERATCLQYDNDPVAVLATLQSFIETNKKTNLRLEIRPGNDHAYSDFETIKPLLV